MKKKKLIKKIECLENTIVTLYGDIDTLLDGTENAKLIIRQNRDFSRTLAQTVWLGGHEDTTKGIISHSK